MSGRSKSAGASYSHSAPAAPGAARRRTSSSTASPPKGTGITPQASPREHPSGSPKSGSATSKSSAQGATRRRRAQSDLLLLKRDPSPVLLGSVNTAHNIEAGLRGLAARGLKLPPPHSTEFGELRAKVVLITRAQKDIAKLLTELSPAVDALVHTYLEQETGPDAMFINAWRKAGERDALRSPYVNVGDQARKTMSAMGLACLIAYTQAWVDARERELLAR